VAFSQEDCSGEQIFLCSYRLGNNDRNLTYHPSSKILPLGKDQPFCYETKVSSSYIHVKVGFGTESGNILLQVVHLFVCHAGSWGNAPPE